MEVNAFNTFNPNTADGNTDINSKISYATHSGFFYIDNKLNVVRNEKFGKMEKVSDNPLTVKYTINEGVKWSDGTPSTAADLVLQWAAFSGYYDDADAEAKTGTSYFSYAGDPTGIALTDFPELGDGQPLHDPEVLQAVRRLGNRHWRPGSTSRPTSLAKKAGLADAKALSTWSRSMPERRRQGTPAGQRAAEGHGGASGTPASTPRPCRPTRTCTCPTARTSSRVSTRTSP